MLTVTRLSKSYRGPKGAVPAVHDISLSVHPGEFLAIQGPSGCGKSTLLLAAGALLTPDAGNVAVNGIDPYALPQERRAAFRAAHIGFVFQQFFLVPYLSVYENILVPSLADRATDGATATNGEDPAEWAAQLVSRFQLQHRRDHKPAQLSTGERQRAAMARALLNRPQLLLADEPTGNLDEKNAHIVLTHLQEFARNGGAVLMVTHSERAAGYADREVHLHDGALELPA